MPKPGDVVLAYVQFADSFEVKVRPALVIMSEFGNHVLAGITSNMLMNGISLTKSDGAIKESVIRLNYLFTVSNKLVKKTLFTLKEEKRKEVYDTLLKKCHKLLVPSEA